MEFLVEDNGTLKDRVRKFQENKIQFLHRRDEIAPLIKMINAVIYLSQQSLL